MQRTLVAAALAAALLACESPAQQTARIDLGEASLEDRIRHHRAIEAAVWAMPLMNFKFYRDALADAGVGPNDVGYFSKLQDWRFQTATPNNTTPSMP